MNKFDLDNWLKIKWQRGNRYYCAYLQQDILGQWYVLRIWGSHGTNRGGRLLIVCNDYDDALQKLNAVEKRRKYKGYLYENF